MFGKSVSDLQSNILVGNGAIKGTLKYVADYTGFSSITEEQSGNYLAIHCENADADEITVELVGGTKGPVKLDGDGIIVLRIANTAQKVCVRAYKDGVLLNTSTYSLSGLVLESGN